MPIRAATRQALLRTINTRLASSVPTRKFFTIPTATSQTLEAKRTLPYNQDSLYELIADVDSYSQFVPYCSKSLVTKWSNPDSNGQRWPMLANLHVGWGGFNEEFTSRLRCVPGVLVEAESGDSAGTSGFPDASSVFKSLITRWSLRQLSTQPSSFTEVHLTINYSFTNPLYAAVSATVSDRMAALMIEAFERQAQHRLGHRNKL